ncbi:HAD hydrolase-like protein [Noviherbaspirillum sp.]|uniref:HAD hydrolase-like protein n=1 Tax=Noviherbaspirillum sp. TaxID=1926288 RepID=UPI002D6F7870|nr:HAD hydrolase-like protein [Noviherbaspirillum sp.]HZW23581.1 HAD hydrolase-like protein [Noviherbaspirillum sp.]
MKYQLAIFDFDGTLADSFPFFLRNFNRLAERHRFRKIEAEEVAALRHYSAREMMRHVGMPHWKLPLVAASFIGLMRESAHDIPLFSLVDDMLRHLSGAGVQLSIISSNAEDNVARILGPANCALFRHFECGMSIFGKSSRIRHVLDKTGVPAHRAIYIGDQVTDLEAARREGVAFGAVAWGYGTIESLRRHAPEEEFDEVPAIKRIA